MRQRTRAAVCAFVVATGLALAVVAPAQASAGGTASFAGGVLTYQGSGTGDEILISYRAVNLGGLFFPFHVVDAQNGDTVTAGPGCTQSGSATVLCAPIGVTSIVVDGGSGDDEITIGTLRPAPDTPNATMYGGFGSDELTGGAGDDTIEDDQPTSCAQGTDVLEGGAGNDTLRGCLGGDSLNGGDGNDVLTDTGGSQDFFSAGAGDDTIRSRDTFGEGVNCGSGTDRVYRDALDSVNECEFFAPRPAGAPTIGGTLIEGQTVTSSTGTWADGPTVFAYQWSRCVYDFLLGWWTCTDIPGATSASYAIQVADVDNALQVTVSGTNSGGSDAQQKLSGAVAALPPQNATLPAITGIPNPGNTLTATDGTWEVTAKAITTYAYQWRRCAPNGSACSDIMGATASTFTTSTADLGASLRVAVTASNAGGDTQVVSPQKAIVRDTKPPNTSIRKKPKARTALKRATFVFVSSEAGSTFQCKLDKGPWRKCKSPKSYGKLKSGKHVFLVRARDKAGNVDRTPAKRTWQIS